MLPRGARSPNRVRSARNAGLKGSARRRPRTTRSKTPRAKGTTASTSVSRTVQPLAARSAKKRLSGVRKAPPTLASSEPSSASLARPSLPNCPMSIAAPALPTAAAESSGFVAESVTAAIPCPSIRPCSSPANGIPRSTSCVETEGSAGRTRVSSSTRAAAVETSGRAGDTGSSPAIASRGGAVPPIPSRTTAAIAERASGDVVAKRSAPAPPYAPASVETSTNVC